MPYGARIAAAAITPATPSGAVQYNDNGVLSGSSKLRWSNTLGGALTLGVEGIETLIVVPDATIVNGEGGELRLHSGNGNGTGRGGDLGFVSGDGGANGGAGGTLIFQGGAGGANGDGGSVGLVAGSGGVGNSIGGFVVFTGGGGEGTGQGGDIILTGGTANGTGRAGNITIGPVLSLASYTVATLPPGNLNDKAMVSDALAPAFGAAVVGGGAVTVPVYFNGASWRVG